MEWQTIESAPRDGTDVLVYDDPFITTAHWVKHPGYRGWWSLTLTGADATDSQCYPSHWMPLPPPPTGDK